MTFKSKLTTLLVFVGISSGYSQITADEAIVAMGRGINMGNTLDATDYEGGTWAPAAEEYYFEMYKEAGFKTVRIPITWNAAVSESNKAPRISNTAPYAIETEFLQRLDTIIKWSLERDMYTIINVHHDGWVKDKNTFDSQKARLYALWTQVAEHYKDYTDMLFFEILNEPHSNNSLSTAQVNELNSECLDIIRVQNPNRIVVYMGPNWSSSADLKAAAIPDTDDEYLIGSYHSYDPWTFAGEAKGTWGTANDKKEMTDQMLSIKEWSDQKSIPVLIGELGAMNSCDYNSRMRYYAHYIEEAMRIGLAFTVWDDDGWFQTLERRDTSWNDAKDIIMHTTQQSPINITSKFHKGDDTTIVVNWSNRAIDCDTIIVEKRINDLDFQPIAKYANDTQSIFIDTVFEVKNYYSYRIISRYNDSLDVYSYPTKLYITPLERSPFHGEPFAVPGTIEAEDFDNGGQGLTYNETTSVNQGDSDYRAGETVDIEVRDDGYQVGFAEEGEWLEYTINVANAGSYEITAHIASQDGGGEIQYIFQNTSAKATAPKTNSWTATQAVSAYAVLDEGEQTMRVKILSTPNYNIDKFEIQEGTDINTVNAKDWTIFPNPASSTLYINGYYETTTATVDIITINGAKVISTTSDNLKNGISIDELNAGFYLVVISNQNTVITKQFLKN